MSSVKRNIIQNGIANVLTKVIRVAEQLLLVPFFLSAWGAAYYGEWLTLSIIPSVLAFADFGFGSAASNSFVLYYSAGNKKYAYDVFKTGIIVVSFTVVLGIILTFLTLLIVDYWGLLEKSLIDTNDAIVALCFMMSAKLMSFYDQLYEALYRSKRRAALGINISTLCGLLKIAIGLLSLFLGYGVVGFASMQFLATLTGVVVYIMGGRFVFSERIDGSWNINEAKAMIRKGLGFMLTPVWQSIYFQGSTFAVRIVLGAESVAVFNTVRTVCRSVNQMYSIVNGSIFPEMQFEYGAGNLYRVQKIFINALRIVLLCALVGVTFLCIFGPDLYSWWTHNTLLVPDSMWYLFMTGILFNALWWTAGGIFRVINKPFRFAIYGLISSCISTLLTYVLSFSLGLTGAAIGYVMMDVLMAIFVLPYACRNIDLRINSIIHV